MAWESTDSRSFNAVPSGALTAFTFVKFSANNTVVVCAGATDVPCGVVQEDRTSTETRAVQVVYMGITKIKAAAAIAAGVKIGTDASGLADAKVAGTDTTEYTVGQMIEGSGAANEIATAMVNCASPTRAA